MHPNQKQALDTAIKQLIQTPDLGELKKGDLAEVRVYKFKTQNTTTPKPY